MEAENHRDQRRKFKKKRKRTVITTQEISVLEESFQRQPKPDRLTKLKLAKQLEKTENFISIWFQNRRARERRERKFSEWDISDKEVSNPARCSVSSNDNYSMVDIGEEQPLDLTTRAIDLRHAPLDLANSTLNMRTTEGIESENTAIVRSPLFSRLIRMAAAAEGGILTNDCPYADQAITDACSGITLQDGRLFYDPTTGFELEGFQ